jgi:hypothetical protein
MILMAAFSGCTLSAQDSVAPIYEAQQIYKTASGNLVKGAEEMPAKDYAFQPTEESPSFGDLIAEVTGAQADVCSAVEGKHVDMEHPFSTSKADLIVALRKSSDRCEAAYSFINNFNATEPIRFGGTPHSRLGLLYLNTTHVSEVYGQLAVYLRLKGLVPPSNRARLMPISGE